VESNPLCPKRAGDACFDRSPKTLALALLLNGAIGAAAAADGARAGEPIAAEPIEGVAAGSTSWLSATVLRFAAGKTGGAASDWRARSPNILEKDELDVVASSTETGETPEITGFADTKESPRVLPYFAPESARTALEAPQIRAGTMTRTRNLDKRIVT
jgi:hypothetical protein